MGCTGGGTPSVLPKSRQSFSDATLAVACSDGALASEFVRRSAAWRSRTGATVKIGNPADCDISVIPPGDLGQFMAKNDALAVPDELRSTAHSIQWTRLLSTWSERLATWGGVPYGIPLAGESCVLVYDRRKFADAETRAKRTIAPPVTWEEFADLAELLARDGRPSLPALPADPDRALREFHFIAACYDRTALSGTDFTSLMQKAGNKESVTASMLAFHHNLSTGEPQLNRPAFVEAARLVKRLAACRPKSGGETVDPLASLAKGDAAMAVVSLAELGRMTRADGAAPDAVGVAPLPGTKVWFDPRTGRATPPADNVRNVNFVPYFGAGGWMGIVHKRCRNPEAAFELLAELSGLDRSTELISDPALGFGPLRVEHLDPSRESVWQRYGFDADRSRKLAVAIRQQAGTGLANPVVGLRGADRAELLKLLAAEVAKLAAGAATPEEAMKAAESAWRKADSARPAESLKAERLLAAGLR